MVSGIPAEEGRENRSPFLQCRRNHSSKKYKNKFIIIYWLFLKNNTVRDLFALIPATLNLSRLILVWPKIFYFILYSFCWISEPISLELTKFWKGSNGSNFCRLRLFKILYFAELLKGIFWTWHLKWPLIILNDQIMYSWRSAIFNDDIACNFKIIFLLLLGGKFVTCWPNLSLDPLMLMLTLDFCVFLLVFFMNIKE